MNSQLKYLSILFTMLMYSQLYSQTDYRNGVVFPANMENPSTNEIVPIRCLLVFVSYSDVSGAPTTVPANAGQYFNPSIPSDPSQLKGVTKYYHEASFGKAVVLGDYYPKVLMVKSSDLPPEDDAAHINVLVNALNNEQCNDIITASGYSVNNGDFDNWTYTNGGTPKTIGGDDKIDQIIFLHLKHGIVHGTGGHMFGENTTIPIKNMIGYGALTCMHGGVIDIQHELSHNFLGGNQFHSGGAGAGTGTYLSNNGGYSLLSSWNRNLNSPNGWDRHRLGWKNSVSTYDINAKTTSYTDVNGDLEYGQTLNTNEFILRDFITYGDAIRIKLPHLKSINGNTFNQYLWLENHQLKTQNSEYEPNKTKGIRINLQVGNDDITSVADSYTNYISPLCSFGNYDFEYRSIHSETQYRASTTINLANPFTGYNFTQSHAFDRTGSRNVDEVGKIYNKETACPIEYFYNGNLMYNNFAFSGNAYDAFPVGSVLNMSSNPAPTPALTYRTSPRYGSSPNPQSPNSDDNRYIFLSGLSINIVKQYSNGDIKVRIRWDDFDVDNDVRWTGSIVLKEELNLKAGYTISLDKGLTPTKPYNTTIYNDEPSFSGRTVFRLKSGSVMTIEDGAKLIIKNNSLLRVENGAKIIVKGSGKIIAECEGGINASPGSIIDLQDPSSRILKGNGSNVTLSSGVLTGNGQVSDFYRWVDYYLGDLTTNTVEGSLAISPSGNVYYKTTTNRIGCLYNSNGTWKKVIINESGTDVSGHLAVDPGGKVFYKTSNSNLACLYYSNNKWNKAIISEAGSDVRGYIAISPSGNIFYRTWSNQMACVYYYNGRWNKAIISEAGQGVAGHLAISSSGNVFYKTTNNGIGCVYYYGGHWNNAIISEAGTNVSGYLAVNSIGVFYKTKTNDLNCIYYSNGSWNKSTLENVAQGIVSGYVVSGNDKVFFKSTDNSMKAVYKDSYWKLDQLGNIANSVGGNIVINPLTNTVFYKTYGTNKNIRALQWTNNCVAYGFKSDSENTISSYSDLAFENEKAEMEADIIENDQFSMYPNPANNTVDLTNTKGDIKIYNSLGILVYDYKSNDINSKHTVKIADWDKGVYTVTITSLDGRKLNKKLLVY